MQGKFWYMPEISDNTERQERLYLGQIGESRPDETET